MEIRVMLPPARADVYTALADRAAPRVSPWKFRVDFRGGNPSDVEANRHPQRQDSRMRRPTPRMDITSFVGKLLEQDDVDARREGVRVLARAVMETEVSTEIGAAL